MRDDLERWIDTGFSRLDARIDRLDAKLDATSDRLEARIDRLDGKIDAVNSRIVSFGGALIVAVVIDTIVGRL